MKKQLVSGLISVTLIVLLVLGINNMSVATNSTGVPSFNRLEIVKTGVSVTPTYSLNTGGANYDQDDMTSVVVPHNLGYRPLLIAFLDINGFYLQLPWVITDTTSGGFITRQYFATVDETNIYIDGQAWGYNSNSSGAAHNIRYYLLRERAD